nr:7071_t:CDS:2 [Entrophospora candida]
MHRPFLKSYNSNYSSTQGEKKSTDLVIVKVAINQIHIAIGANLVIRQDLRRILINGQVELQKWYWDIKDGVENEVSLQFKSADERNVQRSISSSTYRPITESHPLAIYTSRLLSFPNLSRPVRLPSSRSNSNKAYKTEKIDYVTRAFEEELVYEPESNLSTRRIDLEEISEEILSEVTFEPEIIEEEYVTRQYDIDLV